ncbi:LPS-assembly protein LptD [Bdellovibrio reynosensis]|uniref:LPS-assembly protein LptD n=1 Tax=Bdellovibrio reynosensis TaxID=2835041 RepID=A0ABY4CAW5_9BACT|nr:LPS assembly protein LptD [Bdellovibrio reynosensis]UOF01924.1 LPS-assembly protein LptD [Bdellovibrio reynosensis]
MFQNLITLLSALFILLLAVGPAADAAEPTAKIHGILINADSMYRDTEKEMAELEGNIQIVFQGQHIKADRARIHLRVRQLELFGNVEIMDSKNTIVGDRIFLDYDNNTGIIHNGYVQSGSVMFTGSLLQKTGDSSYLVNSADYTACTNCPSTWSFSGTTVRAELGGYAYIKNAVLRFGHVPVFWLPYLIVPLKSDRQSGLLTPNFESSEKGGFAISQPYFWAISRSSDATIELKDYSKRGLKSLLEYRYLLSDTSAGNFSTGMIYDEAFAEDPRLNRFRTAEQKNEPLQRWFILYNHYNELPDEGIHRASINLASDLQYPKDFPTETLNHGDSAMENRVSYTRNLSDQHYSIDASYYVNMLHADPLAGNNDAVHRAPELRFSQSQKSIGESNFLYSVDLNLVNFTRAGNAYDDMTETTTSDGAVIRFPKNTCNSPNWEDDPNCERVYDGSYDPATDFIRTGQRMDVRPTLIYPVKLGEGLDLLPKLSYRETHYNFNIDEDPYLVRRYLRTELSGRFNLSRIYGDTVSSKATRYKHEIAPEITYTRLPWFSQDNHPFFGTGNLVDAPYSSRDSVNDLDIGSDFGAQFDYNDRVYDRNLMTFAVVNKITEKRWISDRPEYRQIGYLKLAQSYDATQEGKIAKEPWSDINATLDVRLDSIQTYSIFNYFPYQNVTNSSSRVRLMNNAGQFVQAQLTRQYKITPGQPVNTTNRQEDYTFSAGFVSKYLNLMGKFVYDANFNQVRGDRVKSWAYIAQFKPPGDCMLITFIHDKVSGGDTNLKLNFEFTFDGVQKAPIAPEALDLYGF